MDDTVDTKAINERPQSHAPKSISSVNSLDGLDRHVLLLLIAGLCLIYISCCTYFGVVFYDKLSHHNESRGEKNEETVHKKASQKTKKQEIGDIESGLAVNEDSNTMTQSATTLFTESSVHTRSSYVDIDNSVDGLESQGTLSGTLGTVEVHTVDTEDIPKEDTMTYLRFSVSRQSPFSDSNDLAITSNEKWQRQMTELQEALGITLTMQNGMGIMGTALSIPTAMTNQKISNIDTADTTDKAEFASPSTESVSTDSYSTMNSRSDVIQNHSVPDSTDSPSGYVE